MRLSRRCAELESLAESGKGPYARVWREGILFAEVILRRGECGVKKVVDMHYA